MKFGSSDISGKTFWITTEPRLQQWISFPSLPLDVLPVPPMSYRDIFPSLYSAAGVTGRKIHTKSRYLLGLQSIVLLLAYHGVEGAGRFPSCLQTPPAWTLPSLTAEATTPCLPYWLSCQTRQIASKCSTSSVRGTDSPSVQHLAAFRGG